MCPIFRRLVRPPSRTIETLKLHTKFSLKACGAYDGTSAYGLLRGGQGCAVLILINVHGCRPPGSWPDQTIPHVYREPSANPEALLSELLIRFEHAVHSAMPPDTSIL
jgi:hypothetical protein